jgi:hypothetical protein
MPGDKIPVKTFFEAVEKRLAKFSPDELRSILRNMAGNIAPGERRRFLENLQPAEEAQGSIQQTLRQDELLSDIDDLTREIREMAEVADDWGDRFDRFGDSWDEEDSLGPYADFVEPLTALFDRTQGVFDTGYMALARAAYHKLFEALQIEDDYGRGVRPEDLPDTDIAEARARYLRAVYETETPGTRSRVLFEEMQRFAQRERLGGFPREGQFGLNDVIQVSPRPLPDREPFLKAWIASLRKRSGADPDRWLREAIQLAEGSAGLAALARKEGKKRPRAYLDWVAALRAEGKTKEAIAAAEEALRKLPRNLPLRAAIADHLCATAQEVQDIDTVRQGRWEAFAANPALARLLDLWEITPPAQRPRQMARAERRLAEYLKRESRRTGRLLDLDLEDEAEEYGWVSDDVLAHAHLLNGNWEAARKMAGSRRVLGWSSFENVQGVVVPTLLALIVGDLTRLPLNVSALWEEALDSGASYFDSENEHNEPARLEAAYQEAAEQKPLKAAQAESLLKWCVEVGKKRAEAIVQGQHRRSYDKAALIAAACAEVLRARGQEDKAEALLEDLRDRFPRHRAFQDELKRAAGKAR